MAIEMTLCPKCKTIQKAGRSCGLCGEPVDVLVVDVVGEPPETEDVRRSKLQEIWDRTLGPWLEKHEFED